MDHQRPLPQANHLQGGLYDGDIRGESRSVTRHCPLHPWSRINLITRHGIVVMFWILFTLKLTVKIMDLIIFFFGLFMSYNEQSRKYLGDLNFLSTSFEICVDRHLFSQLGNSWFFAFILSRTIYTKRPLDSISINPFCKYLLPQLLRINYNIFNHFAIFFFYNFQKITNE